MKINNKLKTIFVSMSLLMSYNAFAVCAPTTSVSFSFSSPGDGMTKITGGSKKAEYSTGTYWKQCWSSVEIHSFGGEAMKQFNSLKTDYQQKYHAVLLESLTEASKQKMVALQSGYEVLLQTMSENYMALSKARIQIKNQMLEEELDYQREMQSKVINEKTQGAFNDANGEGGIVRTDTQSYTYFKEVCKRNKMFSKTSGTLYNQKKDSEVNGNITSKTKELSEATGSTSEIALLINKNHSSEFCSAFDIKYNQCVNPDFSLCVPDDIDSGVCYTSNDEVFKLSNADTDATNFLKPLGFTSRYTYDGDEIEPSRNRIEDELFNVNYTYTPNQKNAANSFANVLIYQPSVKAPTVDEKSKTKNVEFISAYNKYLANLNLANYSFQNAIESRDALPLEGEIPMSERDVLRYLIHSFGSPDALVAAKSGKKLSSDTMIYQLMTIKNKLDLKQFEQKERIETLLAALLAAQANDPALINKLNSLK